MTNSALNGSVLWARTLSDIGVASREKTKIDNQQRELKDIHTVLIIFISLAPGLFAPLAYLILMASVKVNLPCSSISADERPMRTSTAPEPVRKAFASGS